MATVTFTSTLTATYVITGTVGMALGYRIASGVFRAPRPSLQIVNTLDGQTNTWTGQVTSIELAVSGATTWENPLNEFSRAETITVTNSGTVTATVESIFFSDNIASALPLYNSTWGSPPWQIDPGQAADFDLKYVAYEQGQFNEAIFFATDETAGGQRYDVTVTSGDALKLDVGVITLFDTTMTKPRQNFVGTYTATLLKNGRRIAADPQISATISGSPTWSIERVDPYVDGVSSATVTVRFNPNLYNLNTTTPYVSTLTITTALQNVAAVEKTQTMIYNPDTAKNYSSSTWMSTLTQPDVIVGARIDYVQSGTQAERVLTLGVGSGADGSAMLKDGGDLFFDQGYLDPIYGPDRGPTPHPFWQTVYSFRLMPTGGITLFQSKDHRVKTQEPGGRDYDHYFGHYDNSGTMFTLQLEDTGVVRIYWNDLRETTNGVDAVLDQTLERLSRSFYYYSIKDTYLQTRSTGTTGLTYQEVFENGQLVKTYRLNEFGAATLPSDTMTKYFVGFDNSNTIITSLVPSPT